jgi:hypothetical protein
MAVACCSTYLGKIKKPEAKWSYSSTVLKQLSEE